MSDKVRNRTKRIIIWSVIGAHVILLVIPAIVYALTQWLKPQKEVVHKIVLANAMPAGNPDQADNSGGGLVFSRDGDMIWECSNCGHIHVGQKAPEMCPVCAHPQAYFMLRPQNY